MRVVRREGRKSTSRRPLAPSMLLSRSTLTGEGRHPSVGVGPVLSSFLMLAAATAVVAAVFMIVAGGGGGGLRVAAVGGIGGTGGVSGTCGVTCCVLDVYVAMLLLLLLAVMVMVAVLCSAQCCVFSELIVAVLVDVCLNQCHTTFVYGPMGDAVPPGIHTVSPIEMILTPAGGAVQPGIHTVFIVETTRAPAGGKLEHLFRIPFALWNRLASVCVVLRPPLHAFIG